MQHEIVFSQDALFAIYALAGIILGLIISMGFNIKTVRHNSKVQFYQVLKDIEDKFNKIEVEFPIGTNYTHSTYHVSVFNFGMFLKNIIQAGIIDKKLILKNYHISFENAFWILDNILDGDDSDDELLDDEFRTFYKNNNISPRHLISSRLAMDQQSLLKISEKNDDEDESTKTDNSLK